MPTIPFPTDLIAFVIWLGINGATVVALLEKIPLWQRIDGRSKAAFVFVLIVGGPTLTEYLTVLLQTLPAEQLASIQHLVDLLLNGLRLWAASQYAHGGLRQFVASDNPGPLPTLRR